MLKEVQSRKCIKEFLQSFLCKRNNVRRLVSRVGQEDVTPAFSPPSAMSAQVSNYDFLFLSDFLNFLKIFIPQIVFAQLITICEMSQYVSVLAIKMLVAQ